MVEFIVETVQKLLKGEDFNSLNEIISNSLYIESCCSIIEDDETYNFSIRFNVSNGMLFELIKKYASFFSDEKFEELDSFFLQLLSHEESISRPNSIFTNSILANSIGRCYGCLLYSYRKSDKEAEDSFLNIYERINDIMNTSVNHQIACMNVFSGICQFFGSLSEMHFRFKTEPMVDLAFKAASTVFQEEKLNKEVALIQTSLTLLNNYLLMYSKSVNSGRLEDDIEQFSISKGIPTTSLNHFFSPQFLQSFLKEYFIKVEDSNFRLLCLDIFYNLTAIQINIFRRNEFFLNSYNFILQDLDIIIKFIFENASDTKIWDYIYSVCLISVKLQGNLQPSHLKSLSHYPSFLESFFHLSIDIIFSIESDFEAVDQFFGKSLQHFLCLIFWKKLQKFSDFPVDGMKEQVMNYVVEIDQKCLEFLFVAIQKNPEMAFGSFHEIDYSFELIELLVNTMRFQIPFFCENLHELLVRHCQNYYENTSIENEINLSLILSISTQFIMAFSRIPNYEIECLRFHQFSNEDEELSSIVSHDENTMFSDLLGHITAIIELIEKNNDEKRLEFYLSLHQNETEIPTFLENAIMNFINGFKSTIFCEASFRVAQYYQLCQDNPLFQSKNDILNIFIHRLYCDVVVFRNCSIQYNDIFRRVCDIITVYNHEFLFEGSFFDRFYALFDVINNQQYYKKFVKAIISTEYGRNIRNNQTLLGLLSNDTKKFQLIVKEAQKHLEELIKIFINFSTIFNLISKEDDYNFFFQKLFLPNIEIMERYSEFLFTNQATTPFALTFILTVIKGESRIQFPKHSANGILLFRSTMKFLCCFYKHLHSHANDNNIGNYLKCVHRSLKIYNTIITAKYVMFRALQIYNDSTLINSIQSITNFLMQFKLKNLFSFPKLELQLKGLAVNLFEKHHKEIFMMEPPIIHFLYTILEFSLFAPNAQISLDTVYTSLSAFIDVISDNEQFRPLCEFLGADLQRLFLEMWQNIFNSKYLLIKAIGVLRSLFSFFSGYPENSRETILAAIREDFVAEFNEHLENILNDPSSLEKEIEQMHAMALHHFPYGLIIFNSFPLNWASLE